MPASQAAAAREEDREDGRRKEVSWMDRTPGSRCASRQYEAHVKGKKQGSESVGTRTRCAVRCGIPCAVGDGGIGAPRRSVHARSRVAHPHEPGAPPGKTRHRAGTSADR